MQEIIDWLKGKKVYFICASAILAAFTGWLQDEISLIQFVEAIFIALGAMALRAGMAKTATK